MEQVGYSSETMGDSLSDWKGAVPRAGDSSGESGKKACEADHLNLLTWEVREKVRICSGERLAS